MKPFQPRCPGAQIERKWPATKDYFSFGEEAIAFLAGPRAGGAWCQVACRGEGRPRFANFAVIPAPGVGQFDRRIDRLDLRSIFGADALNTQDLDPLHGLPSPATHPEQANHSVSPPRMSAMPESEVGLQTNVRQPRVAKRDAARQYEVSAAAAHAQRAARSPRPRRQL